MVTGLLQCCRGVNVGDSHSVAFPNFRSSRVDGWGLQVNLTADSMARREQEQVDRLHTVLKSWMSPYGVTWC